MQRWKKANLIWLHFITNVYDKNRCIKYDADFTKLYFIVKYTSELEKLSFYFIRNEKKRKKSPPNQYGNRAYRNINLNKMQTKKMEKKRSKCNPMHIIFTHKSSCRETTTITTRPNKIDATRTKNRRTFGLFSKIKISPKCVDVKKTSI